MLVNSDRILIKDRHIYAVLFQEEFAEVFHGCIQETIPINGVDFHLHCISLVIPSGEPVGTAKEEVVYDSSVPIAKH